MTSVSEIERLYHEVAQRLWWSLLGYTADPEIASDAVAEAFARACRYSATIDQPASWIWAVAFRIASDELRHRRRQAPEPVRTYEIDDRTLDVMVALRRLSDRQRVVFVLFYLEDMSTAQIAELLGMNATTVSVHLHRARKRLRTILGDDYD